jgi:hypothetical protein
MAMSAPQPPYPPPVGRPPMAPPPVGPPLGPPGVVPRPGRSASGTAVVVVLVVAVLLCLGVGTTGYLLVVRTPAGADQPPGAASGLLTAMFRSQSTDDAERYICAEQRDPQSVQDLLSQAAQYGQSGRVSWSTPHVKKKRSDGSVLVTTMLKVSSQAQDTKGDTRRWTFTTVDERGWRVCDIKT